MSYVTYTTEAIVCGSYARMTADKSYLLFTKDAGMLFATARSVREERSRQRYALQDFSLVRVSLVKGKSGWRIGSVEGMSNAFTQATARATRAGVVRVVQHLRRYVRGEEPVPAVWHDADEALAAIAQVTHPETIAQIERVFLFRMLTTLGYIAPSVLLRALTATDLAQAVAACDSAKTALLETHIARAEQVSHL